MKNRWTVILGAALATVLAGCGGGEEGSEDQARGGSDAPGESIKVYRHAMDQAPTTLDPAQAAVIYTNFIVLNAYDTLYSYYYLKRPYELRPNLAAAMPEISEDGLVYTIPLKQGVEFIDDESFAGGVGREVTAEDFIYSIKRHFDPSTRSQGAWLWQDRIVGLDAWKDGGADYDAEVEGLKALDSHTVQITLVEPYPQLLFTLAMGFSAVVPREAVDHYGREIAVRPVGSGPFKVVSFDTAKVVMEKNPKYRQEPVDLDAEGFDPATQSGYGLESIEGRSPPFVDRMEVHFIGETAARWAAFTKGSEVQFTLVPVEQIDSVLASKNPITAKPEIADQYHVHNWLEAGFIYTAFNMADEQIGMVDDPQQAERNKALRCAMIKAFDWPERNKRFYFGMGQVFPGYITPVVPEFDPDADRWTVTRDLDEAKRMLADNGWNADNLPELVYGMPATVTQRQIFEQFRSWMEELGFPRDKIRGETFATFGDFNRAIKNRQLMVFGLGWGLDYPDAENTLQLLYGPNETPGSNNFNYTNPEYDALYRQASTMLPSEERTEIYRRMNEIAIDDCVAISGMSRTRVALWHKNVVMYPDREILGGFFLKYVDVRD